MYPHTTSIQSSNDQPTNPMSSQNLVTAVKTILTEKDRQIFQLKKALQEALQGPHAHSADDHVHNSPTKEDGFPFGEREKQEILAKHDINFDSFWETNACAGMMIDPRNGPVDWIAPNDDLSMCDGTGGWYLNGPPVVVPRPKTPEQDRKVESKRRAETRAEKRWNSFSCSPSKSRRSRPEDDVGPQLKDSDEDRKRKGSGPSHDASPRCHQHQKGKKSKTNAKNHSKGGAEHNAK